MYGKNESSIREVMNNKEKILVRFSVALQTAKFTAIARDKVIMKVEKALNFWMEDTVIIKCNKEGYPLYYTLLLLYLMLVMSYS